MSPIRNIAIVGAGAMGAIYASKFYEIDPGCVALVASEKRYENLEKNGLIVNDKTYRVPVVRPEEKTNPSDLILVAVKNHHLPEAIEAIRNRVGDGSIILSVMNGIDSEEQIGAVYGPEKVVYAMAAGIDAVRDGNRVSFSTSGRIVFGEKVNRILSDRVKRIQVLLDDAGITHHTPEDMIRMLWWKFMVNVGMNQVSAILRGTYGIFQTSPTARELMVSAMQEVVALAGPASVNLSGKDIEDWFPVMATMSADGKTSMLQDIEAKRKTEVEMFAGRVIELGKKYGVSTPLNEAMFKIIRAMEETY